jgi:hypothetical protein
MLQEQGEQISSYVRDFLAKMTNASVLSLLLMTAKQRLFHPPLFAHGLARRFPYTTGGTIEMKRSWRVCEIYQMNGRR